MSSYGSGRCLTSSPISAFAPPPRYIIVGRNHWREQRKLLDVALPSLRASLIKDQNPAIMYPDHEDPPRHTAELRRLKDVTLTTLSSILRDQLRWTLAGEETSQSEILGISRVTFAATASLYAGVGPALDLFKPAQHALQMVGFDRADGKAQDANVVEGSIKTVLHLVKPPGPGDKCPLERELLIKCERKLELEAWMCQLCSEFPLVYICVTNDTGTVASPCQAQPILTPRICLTVQNEMRPKGFITYAHAFLRVYRALWYEVFQGRNGRILPLLSPFQFVVRTPKSGELPRYRAEFSREPEQIGFRALIEEFLKLAGRAGNSEDRPAVVLEDNDYLPLDLQD